MPDRRSTTCLPSLESGARKRIGTCSRLLLPLLISIGSSAPAVAQGVGQRIGGAWIALEMPIAEVERALGQYHILRLVEGRADGTALYGIVESSSGVPVGSLRANNGRVWQVTTSWTPADGSALALAEVLTEVIARIVVRTGEPPTWRTATNCDISVLDGVRDGDASFTENAIHCGRHTIRIVLATPPDRDRYVLIEHQTR